MKRIIIVIIMLLSVSALAQTSPQAWGGLQVFLAGIQYGFLYSAAGTPLPTCNSGTKGMVAIVSDATATVTYHGTYTSGSTVVSPVFCNEL